MTDRSKIVYKSTAIGIVAALLLVSFYFSLVGFIQSWDHAVDLFTGDFWFVMAIAGGFGTQVGLYSYVKRVQKLIKSRKLAAITASGTGTSTVSMLACCLHHLGDVLPLIGLSGVTLFFERYRYPVMGVGIVINLIGIGLMLRLIVKNRLWPGILVEK
ncbi:hypothetical protein Tfer_0750 [Thermincola ferriacetica]|uniref:Uncharacterized protein n=1 Tax=Thermincola ferriacetica TaxID=281456 RepID=A0A0L6W521_9FIRM|nr:hypothetical protein [Thermincola ferriacetica]KNZ70566.1 hypothetical protein Tfer_0750 [Thermincola ferriacetica]